MLMTKYLRNYCSFPVKRCSTIGFEENAFFRRGSTFYGS
jgi:hypothetical protein